MAQYSTGTITVVNTDATVEGSGVNWGSTGVDPGNIAAGDLLSIEGSGVIYEVASVTDSDTLELTSPFSGTGGSYNYSIVTDFTTNLNIPYPNPNDIDQETILKRMAVMLDGFLYGSEFRLNTTDTSAIIQGLLRLNNSNFNAISLGGDKAVSTSFLQFSTDGAQHYSINLLDSADTDSGGIVAVLNNDTSNLKTLYLNGTNMEGTTILPPASCALFGFNSDKWVPFQMAHMHYSTNRTPTSSSTMVVDHYDHISITGLSAAVTSVDLGDPAGSKNPSRLTIINESASGSGYTVQITGANVKGTTTIQPETAHTFIFNGTDWYPHS